MTARLAGALFFVIATTALAHAQALPNLGDTASPAPREPGHALIVGPHEVTDPANGSVTFTFKIPLPPGRGFTPDFTISYSSAGSHVFDSYGNDIATMAAQQSLFSSDGWSYGVPVLTYTWYQQSPDGAETCQVSTAHVVQMPDGSRKQLGISLTGQIGVGAPPGDNCPQWYDEELQSEDNGWASVEAGAQDNRWCWCEVDVTTPDGVTVVFPGGQPTPTNGVVASSMTDRNGNKITYSATSSNALTLTDTLGRVLTTNGFAQSVDTISVPGMTEDYFVQWANAPASAVSNVAGAGANPCPNTAATSQGGPAVTSIAAPEGTYAFTYDPFYGVVDRITYPNGGYVRYVWGMNPLSEPAQLQVWNGSEYQGCSARFDNPVITDRYVSADGVERQSQAFRKWMDVRYFTAAGGSGQ